jgi:ABC-type oligopeptide transport system substrate-binding subunit
VRGRKGSALLALVSSVLIVASACQRVTPGSGNEISEGGVFRLELKEPGSLDPPIASGSEDAIVVKLLFDGLVLYNEKTAAIEPGVATKWESNADATKWTFHLRPGTKFSNGEEVTADSFVQGMTRATSTDLYNNPGGLGYHLDGVVGTADHSAGTIPNLPGVKATDKYTLEVNLSAPDAEFPVRAGHMPFFPVPLSATIAGRKPSWDEFPIGNGPFKMKGTWIHNQSITLVRNPLYYGNKPHLNEVDFKILPDIETNYLEWQKGNIDWARINPANLTEAKQKYPGEYLVRDMAGFDYLVATTKKAPMDNKLFRQALSMSIDRKKTAETVFFGLPTPASGIVPQLIPGSRSKGAVGPCKYCVYDPAKAKQLFQQSGVKIDKLQMFFNAGAGHDTWMAATAQQIHDVLGIQVEAVAGTSQFTGANGYTGRWLKRIAPASLDRLSWGMDYPTPDNFLYPLLYSTSSDNNSSFSNPDFDKLINEARGTIDAAKRVKLYQQAEDLALEEMPILPMRWRTQFRLANLKKFGGLSIDPFEYPTLRTAYVKSTASP